MTSPSSGLQFWASLVAVGCVWLVTLPRMIPSAWSGGDHGTFVSVAERLAAGDRLYVDVWDNKDPLFYYLLALARTVGGVGDALLEIVWLVIACFAASRIVASCGGGRCLARFAGWALTPIVLTGTAYDAGMTHLPASAACLGLFTFVLHDRWAAGGAVLAALVFLKLTMIPVALALMVVAIFVKGDRRGALRASLAALAFAGLFVGLMAVRGELFAYLTAQRLNVGYSGSELVESQWGPIVGHLLRVFPVDLHSQALVTVAATCLLLVVSGLGGSWESPGSGARILVLGAWWSLIAAISVLAVTGMWPHHAQILYVPGVLAVMVLTLRIPWRSLPWWRRGVTLLVVAVLVGGVVHPYTFLTSVRQARQSVLSLSGPSSEAVTLLAVAPTGRYARLGSNDTDAHARGLGSWTLGCPRFTQYHFDPPWSFEEALTCLPTVDAVLVLDGFAPESDQPSWNAFVIRARSTLASQFHCRPESYGELCTHVR